jgi:hypothetical protein
MKPVKPINSPVIVTILRYPLFVLIALLPGLFVSGQVKFTTVVSSQNIGKEDYLQVEFVVENARQIDDLTPPDFPGFHIAQGPIQSSGMSIVNGNMSQYKGLSFVLQPAGTGKFTIGGAAAVVDGKHMRSNVVVVNVHAGGSGAAGSHSNTQKNASPFNDPFAPEPRDVEREYVLRPGENIKDKIRKNLFVKVQVDKNSCYVGEPIVATYKLYSRLSSESRVTKRPSLNGFSVYDMIDPGTDAVSVEKLNGKEYTVHIIRKTQLIPLQAGSIDLDPVEVENTVHFVKGGREARHNGSIRDLLDQLTGEDNFGPALDENVTLDTKPLTITVKPLPDNKPEGFNGAVGAFSIEASIANKNFPAREDATLHVVVRGKGNLPVINAPAVSFPSALESFEPTAKEDINKTVAPMSGTKSFDYVFTATAPGHYTIPSISFPYFDPASQTYKTAGTEPMDIQVTPAVRKAGHDPAGSAGKTGISPGIGKLVQDHLEWIFAILLISAVATYFWRQNLRLRKSERQKAANESSAGGQEAAKERVTAQEGRSAVEKQDQITVPGMTTAYIPAPAPPAVDPLLGARELFGKGEYKGFYREVNRAIWKAINRKLDLPASELNKHNSVRQLKLRGWDAQAILSLENILNECEMNLYTPAYDRENAQQLLQQAERMLDRLA